MSKPEEHKDNNTALPVGPFMREEILARLRTAWRLATRNLPGHLEHVRRLASEVVERVDGITLVAAHAASCAAPAARLPFTMLSAAGGEPVCEFLLIPFGEVRVERPVAGAGFVFTHAHAESAVRWFERMGRKLAIDYEHQSFDRLNTRPDGLRPAAGWIGGLEIRDDGLWAVDVVWTERAAELLRNGEYRYFSPVIFWTDEDYSDVAGLGPVALTNDPALCALPALAACREGEAAAVTEVEMPVATAYASDGSLLTRLEAAEQEITSLRRQLAAQRADAFVERGMRLGKILDSTSLDWRADYLRDPEGTEERLARAPVVLPPGRLLTDRAQTTAPGQRERPVQAGGFSADATRDTVEPEDLKVFARVSAAGRVLLAGSTA